MKPTRRTNRDGAAGARLVAQYGESEQTQREFCEPRGLSVGTLQYWLRKIVPVEAERRPSAPQWVEVRLTEPEPKPVSAPATKGSDGYEVVFARERRLRISPGFDPAEVAVLLTLLEARAC